MRWRAAPRGVCAHTADDLPEVFPLLIGQLLTKGIESILALGRELEQLQRVVPLPEVQDRAL